MINEGSSQAALKQKLQNTTNVTFVRYDGMMITINNIVVKFISTIEYRMEEWNKKIIEREQIISCQTCINKGWGTNNVFIVNDFNFWINGVDIADQTISHYHVRIQYCCIWIPLMFHPLSIVQLLAT